MELYKIYIIQNLKVRAKDLTPTLTSYLMHITTYFQVSTYTAIPHGLWHYIKETDSNQHLDLTFHNQWDNVSVAHYLE